MVEKISVEIGLEGGDDVRKTLEEIVGGVDGLKSAAEDLGQTDVTLAVKSEGADETKTAIDEVKVAAVELGQTDATVKVGVEGADEARAALDGLGGSAGEAKGPLDTLSQTATILGTRFDALGEAFTKMGARMTRALGPLGVVARALGPLGIAAGVAAGALLKFGDSSADALNKLTVESAKLGLTAQQLDTLQQAFGKLGVGSDVVASSLEKLKPLLGGGMMRVGDIVPPDVFAGIQQFIAQLERMPDGVARTKLAIDTLGEALGGQVIAGLQTGANSAQIFRDAINSVTPATQAQIAEAAKYQQSLNQLSAAWTRLKGTIAPITTPVFNFLAQEIDKFINDLKFLGAYWQVFKAAITGGDIGAAARKAAEDYNKATKALQQTGAAAQQAGAAAQQTGQQAASGAQVATVEFTRFGEITQQAFQQTGQAAQQTGQAAQQTGQAAQQAGQQAAQGGQTAASGFLVWDEVLGRAVAKTNTVGTAAAQAGQQAAQGAQQGATAWETLPAAVDQAIASVTSFASTMGTIAWDFISSTGVAAWNLLTSAIQAAIDKMLQFIGLKPSAPATGGGAPGKARGGLLGGRGTGTSDSNLAWLSRGEYIMPARVVAKPGVASFLEALRRSGNIPGFAQGGLAGGGGVDVSPIIDSIVNIVNQIDTTMRSYAQSMDTLLDTFVRGLREAYAALDESMARIQDSIISQLRDLNQLTGSTSVITKNASGGLLGGRGTGTSDSNLAWVSRGEHIMPARAVAQPGVLAFLEALRRSGGDLSRVLDGMGRFALGGLVPRAIPAFATGGLAGGMSNVTIQFPGLPDIGGLRASSSAVDELRKAAALAQVRSGGRKPSRYS